MIVSVFRRRLKDGASFDDFIEAWKADEGFGVPARVFNAVSLDDPREIISIGFVDTDASTLGSTTERVADQEAVRHARIETVVESSHRTLCELKSEHDFTGDPREIDPDSDESLLRSMR